VPVPEHPVLTIGPPIHYVEIDGDALYLGRDCHLAAFIAPLLNKTVSNRHCAVHREPDGRWMLEDLGSTNGTWMRGTRLFGRVLLHTGDAFTLGKQGPICECWQGFGGTGPDATLPEDERTRIAEGSASRDRGSGPTIVAGRDGSAEKPYRVGKTPEIVLRHQRTGQEYRASGYTIVLGRDPGAAQVLIRTEEEKHVSGHFEIQFRSDGSVVGRDLGSRNASPNRTRTSECRSAMSSARLAASSRSACSNDRRALTRSPRVSCVTPSSLKAATRSTGVGRPCSARCRVTNAESGKRSSICWRATPMSRATSVWAVARRAVTQPSPTIARSTPTTRFIGG